MVSRVFCLLCSLLLISPGYAACMYNWAGQTHPNLEGWYESRVDTESIHGTMSFPFGSVAMTGTLERFSDPGPTEWNASLMSSYEGIPPFGWVERTYAGTLNDGTPLQVQFIDRDGDASLGWDGDVLHQGGGWDDITISIDGARAYVDIYSFEGVAPLHCPFDLGPGDTNLDGTFSSDDLVQVMQAGAYETGELASWPMGDWNADHVFDSGDLVAAMATGTYETGTVPVPEPAGVAILLLGCSCLVFWFRS